MRTAFERVKATGDAADAILQRTKFLQADSTSADDWKRLLKEVDGDELVVYFALPPSVVFKVAGVLKDLDLPKRTVLAVEKPFGTDADSAAELNEMLRSVVAEDQIHRVDHFLGQRATLAMLALRFDNRLFDPIWNADDVERVEIVYDEQLGLEGRAGYYDSAGALKDMLQSHLLQVLSVVATEAPSAVDAVDLRDATAAALRATRVWEHGPVFPNTEAPSRRARYAAGDVGDKHLPSYVDEEGVDPEKKTETLAEIALEVRTARWAGVPFVLRSGKAIGAPRDEIVLTLRPVRHRPDGQVGDAGRERIVIGFKPPRLSLELTAGGGVDAVRPRARRRERQPAEEPGDGVRRGDARGARQRPDAVGARRRGGAVLADRAADPRRLGQGRGPARGVPGRQRRPVELERLTRVTCSVWVATSGPGSAPSRAKSGNSPGAARGGLPLLALGARLRGPKVATHGGGATRGGRRVSGGYRKPAFASSSARPLPSGA